VLKAPSSLPPAWPALGGRLPWPRPCSAPAAGRSRATTRAAGGPPPRTSAPGCWRRRAAGRCRCRRRGSRGSSRRSPRRPGSAPAGARWRRRVRKRRAECVRESGIERVGGRARRQRNRALSAPYAPWCAAARRRAASVARGRGAYGCTRTRRAGSTPPSGPRSAR
jgi:hypothetical protein